MPSLVPREGKGEPSLYLVSAHALNFPNSTTYCFLYIYFLFPSAPCRALTMNLDLDQVTGENWIFTVYHLYIWPLTLAVI